LDDTLSKPPAMSPAIQLTQIRPMTITIICTKVVIATDHMPPNRVYTSTTPAPISMPWFMLTVARQHVEHQPERGDLRRHPAQVGQHDADRQHELGRAVVAHAEEVAQREQVHAVQRAGEEQAEQHQAQEAPSGSEISPRSLPR
jgi:hypothetical protein